MAEAFGFRIDTKPFTRDLRAMEKRTDRATMWALREVGREMKRAARRGAPVGDGSDPREKPGELKAAIGSSKRLKRTGRGAFTIKVGPRGQHVHLYAPKAEARTRFMQRAYDEVVPRIHTIHERAWGRAMKKA